MMILVYFSIALVLAAKQEIRFYRTSHRVTHCIAYKYAIALSWLPRTISTTISLHSHHPFPSSVHTDAF